MAKVLDHGYVELVRPWGTEEEIIEAARMSTDGGFRGWGPTLYSCPCHNPDTCDKCRGKGCYEVSGDEKLLGYLYKHKHMTPFEMAGMVIEVQAPIMVFREWHRHRTQSYNEMSGRYTELPDLYYIPAEDRIQRQSTTNKQASGELFEGEIAMEAYWLITEATVASRKAYEKLLGLGVAREIARLVLPVNQYSRMRASANLRNWLAFLTLRQDPAAQYEIRMYANEVAKLIETHFPRTYKLFSENNT